MNRPDSCWNCKHCGFDLEDGPYCVNPVVSKGFSWGILLHCEQVSKLCPTSKGNPHWEKIPLDKAK